MCSRKKLKCAYSNSSNVCPQNMRSCLGGHSLHLIYSLVTKTAMLRFKHFLGGTFCQNFIGGGTNHFKGPGSGVKTWFNSARKPNKDVLVRVVQNLVVVGVLKGKMTLFGPQVCRGKCSLIADFLVQEKLGFLVRLSSPVGPNSQL